MEWPGPQSTGPTLGWCLQACDGSGLLEQHSYLHSLSHTGHLNHPTTEGHGAGVQETWGLGPAEPSMSYVTLVCDSLFFSEPWFFLLVGHN